MEQNQISKTQKKLQQRNAKKYYKKALNSLKEFKNVNIVTSYSKCLFIGNGGMLCGQNRENMLTLCSQYGEIEDLVMIPKKSFSFVQYQSVESAEKAAVGLDGHNPVLPKVHDSQPIAPFHIQMLDVQDLDFARDIKQNNKYPDENEEKLLINGLSIEQNFIDSDYENELFDFFYKECTALESGDNVLRHRSVLHYAYKFLYGSNNIDKDKPLNDGIPKVCKPLLDKILEMKILNHYPDQLTVNKYRPGQGIPPHIDTHSAFEDGILSLTLNSQVVMDFSDPKGLTVPVLLQGRSLLVMKGESRYLWTHGITPRKFDIVYSTTTSSTEKKRRQLTMRERSVRISLTFRTILREPCRCPFPAKCDSQDPSKKAWAVPISQNEANSLESELVNKVYEEIAEHFSDTRHSPWPRVKNFLCSLPNGSLVADVGCGNGKYLGVNKSLVMLGSDRSINLASICEERGHQVLVSDCLTLPYRSSSFDGCICIAVIHHMSTEQRRLEALHELVRITRVGGLVLVYVWALEQEADEEDKEKDGLNISNDTREKSSLDNDTDKHNGGDKLNLDASDKRANNKEHQKYIQVAAGRNTFQQQDLLVPWHLKNSDSNQNQEHKDEEEQKPKDQVFHRFYHVFKRGELKALCCRLPNVSVKDLYLDRGNWCIVLEKTASQL